MTNNETFNLNGAERSKSRHTEASYQAWLHVHFRLARFRRGNYFEQTVRLTTNFLYFLKASRH